MDPLTIAKASRTPIRTSVSKLVAKGTEILQEDVPHHEKSEKAHYIAVTLSDKNNKLQELDAVITAELVKDKTKSTEYADDAIKQEEYQTTINLLLAELYQLSRAKDPNIPQPPLQSSINVNTEPQRHTNVKLPTLHLTHYDGNSLNWLSFWDNFRPNIHENPQVASNATKFSYLTSVLDGEAADAIAGLTTSDDNYAVAISILKRRFGNHDLIKNHLMLALTNLFTPSLTRSSLQIFRDTLEKYTRQLASLGKNEDTYDSMLAPLIFNKLPSKIKENIIRKYNSRNPTLGNIRSSLDTEIDVLSTVPDTMDSQPPSALFGTTLVTQVTPQTPQLVTPQYSRNKPLPCVYCRGAHSSTTCSVVVSADERITILHEAGRCTNCFSPRHLDCPSYQRCRQCGQKHHTSICTAQGSARPEETNEYVNLLTSDTKILLMVAKCDILSDTGNESCAHVLFDGGSQRSYITRDLATQLHCKPIGRKLVKVSSFGGKSENATYMDYVSINIKTPSGCIPVYPLIRDGQLTTELDILATKKHVGHLDYLLDIQLANQGNTDKATIQLLIGADHYHDIVEAERRTGNGPTAIRSKVGWLLNGPLLPIHPPTVNDRYCQPLNIGAYNTVVDFETEDDSLNEIVAKLWDLEAIGISEPQQDEREFLDEYCASLTFDENTNQYTAGLPWNCLRTEINLPDNYYTAIGCLKSVVGRLQKSDLILIYDSILKEQEELGFIEEVTEHVEPTEVHYLTHHYVEKSSTTTPIRIVYNCSKKSGKNKSLNDHLLTGPSTVQDMVSLLLRFRVKKFGLSADIEKAFLMINLNKDDRDYCRFLWIQNTTKPDTRFLKIYRFKVVLFGATSSPFMLGATIQHHLEQYGPSSIADDMKQNFYVDNLVAGVDSSYELSHYIATATEIMQKGGFNLRQWTSNSPDIQQHTPVQTVLGIQWDTSDDLLRISQKDVKITLPATKRTSLSESLKFFDPYGLIAPISIRTKMLQQELWEKRIDWDQPLPPQLQLNWIDMCIDIQTAVRAVSLPRQYMHRNTTQSITLHTFADASKSAFGTVCYLVQDTTSAFVMAKARVAPRKQKTLPQLELIAAVMAVRLSQFVTKALITYLTIDKFVYWSDSQITLRWIKSSKRLKAFVQSRVDEIRKLSNTDDWYFVPTDLNPSDLLTRGVKSINNELWLRGPQFLTNGTIEEFTTTLLTVTDADLGVNTDSADEMEDQPERNEELPFRQSSFDRFTDPTGRRILQPSDTFDISKLIDINRFSDYSKLLRVTVYVIRFIGRSTIPRAPSAEELEMATRLWIKSIQRSTYPDDFKALNTGKRTQLIRNLRLFKDEDGIICGSGRIHNAPVDENTKYPALIPPNSLFTEMLILRAHTKIKHQGVPATLAELQTMFWIPKGRQKVKSVIRRCTRCLRVSGPHYPAPDSPPLPKCRVADVEPFTVTGVDFSGALYVYSEDDSTRVESKAYVCLFTCASSRNLHLEVVRDLTTDHFINALRRLCSRKSKPTEMISDNATTFKAAADLIPKLVQNPAVQDFLAVNGMKWTFIPNRAPWFGGFWERLIGVTKSALRKVLGRAKITFEELRTLLTEIECELNNRPLTVVPSMINELEALTPSHMMYGRRMNPLVPTEITEDEMSDPEFELNARNVESRVKRRLLLKDQYLSRWKSEYLPALREHQSALRKAPVTQSIRVGDVVMIHEDGPRMLWKIGLVTGIVNSPDGYVRVARLRTANGTTNRPVTKLYPLELNLESDDQNLDERDQYPPEPRTKESISKNINSDTTNERAAHPDDTTTRSESSRPTRRAAIQAQARVKKWAAQLSNGN